MRQWKKPILPTIQLVCIAFQFNRRRENRSTRLAPNMTLGEKTPNIQVGCCEPCNSYPAHKPPSKTEVADFIAKYEKPHRWWTDMTISQSGSGRNACFTCSGLHCETTIRYKNTTTLAGKLLGARSQLVAKQKLKKILCKRSKAIRFVRYINDFGIQTGYQRWIHSGSKPLDILNQLTLEHERNSLSQAWIDKTGSNVFTNKL